MELVEEVARVLVATFESHTGFFPDPIDEDYVQAYYGGNWVKIHVGQFATALLPILARERAEGRAQGIEEAAKVAYIACAETRHVSLGIKCEDAIRNLSKTRNA